jgi:hypothetical protein
MNAFFGHTRSTIPLRGISDPGTDNHLQVTYLNSVVMPDDPPSDDEDDQEDESE